MLMLRLLEAPDTDGALVKLYVNTPEVLSKVHVPKASDPL